MAISSCFKAIATSVDEEEGIVTGLELTISSNSVDAVVLSNNKIENGINATTLAYNGKKYSLYYTNITSLTVNAKVCSSANIYYFSFPDFSSFTNLEALDIGGLRVCPSNNPAKNEISFLTLKDLTKLNSLILPTTNEAENPMTVIGENSFQRCANLTTLDLTRCAFAENCSHIFDDCTALKEIIFPESGYRYAYLKEGRYNLSTYNGIYDTYGMFKNCKALTTLTNFSTLGFKYSNSEDGHYYTSCPHGYMFYNCEALTSIVLPGSITLYNPKFMFYHCDNLSSLTKSNNSSLNICNDSAADGIDCQSMFEYCKAMPTESLQSIKIVVSDSTINASRMFAYTNIESYELNESITNTTSMFDHCEELKSITFSDISITNATSMFEHCRELETITIPGTVNIGNHTQMFAECDKGLTSVKLSHPITTGSNMFAGCTALESVTIENSISNGSNMFAGCTALESVTIENSISNGSNMFAGCIALESVTIENSISNGSNMFAGCIALKSVKITGHITNTTMLFDDTSNYENLTLVSYHGSSAIDRLDRFLPSIFPLNLNLQFTYISYSDKQKLKEEYFTNKTELFYVKTGENTYTVFDSKEIDNVLDKTKSYNGIFSFNRGFSNFAASFNTVSRNGKEGINCFYNVSEHDDKTELTVTSNIGTKKVSLFLDTTDHSETPASITYEELDIKNYDDAMSITFTLQTESEGNTYSYSKTFNLSSAHCLMKLKPDGNLMIRNSKVTVCPIGMITPFAGIKAPTGWLLCDGSLYSIKDYPELYNVIGTTYGSDSDLGNSGTMLSEPTKFKVPNLGGRIPIGVGANIDTNESQRSFSIAEAGGEYSHKLSLKEMPSHSHTFYGGYTGGSTNVSRDYLTYSRWNMSGWNNELEGFINHAGTDARHNNIQPYLAVNYIICAY